MYQAVQQKATHNWKLILALASNKISYSDTGEHTERS